MLCTMSYIVCELYMFKKWSGKQIFCLLNLKPREYNCGKRELHLKLRDQQFKKLFIYMYIHVYIYTPITIYV